MKRKVLLVGDTGYLGASLVNPYLLTLKSPVYQGKEVFLKKLEKYS